MACRPGNHSGKCGSVEGRPGYCACGCSVWGAYCEDQHLERLCGWRDKGCDAPVRVRVSMMCQDGRSNET
jgi:hypothetical protein